MPEIIDILTSEPKNCMTMTADNTVDYVQTIAPGGVDFKMYNSNIKGKFQAGDNLSIISAGYILPESYTLWKQGTDLITKTEPAMQRANFYLVGATSGAIYSIDSLGANPGIYLPLENYEHELDIFIDTTKQFKLLPPNTALNEPFFIFLALIPMLISQKSQPAANNGKVFIIVPFLKVAHNLPLLA